jgi:hypothetical protein
MDSAEFLIFNGIDARTGGYLLPPLAPEQVSKLAQGERLEPAHLNELRWRFQQATQAHYGVKAGVDPFRLEEGGWGVIFAHDADPAVKEALAPLLELRRAQASRIEPRRYREFTGPDGHRPGESKNRFLARHELGPGPADPDRVPYYLLIVGSPERIPYRFQYQLDVTYAVGRLCFDTPEEYARYAQGVVAAEAGPARPRRAAFFGVRNPGDAATQLSADQLVAPLAKQLADEQPTWQVQTVLAEAATKQRLARLLGGDETPDLLFTASHGMGFPRDDPLLLPHQGALLCQDWPGPLTFHGEVPHDFYLAGEDVGADADVAGLLSFHFACYGAGTPRADDFPQPFAGPEEIAPQAFVAALPRRLLGHPKGAALAAVGHVERAWGYSFLWGKAGAQREVFRSALQYVMEGRPLGAAVEFFNERYAEIATVLSAELEDVQDRKSVV